MSAVQALFEKALPHWPACAVLAMFLVGLGLLAILTVLAVGVIVHDFIAGARKVWSQP